MEKLNVSAYSGHLQAEIYSFSIVNKHHHLAIYL